ncbi:hypothetical protein CAEBREN_09528 [Caenorhabditis brenneri]|uniref:Uncharacterized protein n=1 Tax=Caenorhabditis brenneri TaxID=135651 RepID=G0MMH2_CAEBE|nr:hypothetical protein CAEBREN_09528 [Caenorhabditis brenneri]
MSDKPISYDSLKKILQYMEANQRIELYTRCPSIRVAEKTAPLKINELDFKDSGVCINNTIYKIGVYRKYHAGSAPKAIVKANKEGGVCHEVDRFGMKDKSDEITATHGDVVLEKTSVPNSAMSVPGATPERELGFIKRKIELCEMVLAMKREGKGNLLSRLKALNLIPPEGTESDLEEARAKLFAWECRRDNVTPPYDHFIVMSTTSQNNEQKRFEGYMYNKTYREAVKCLTARIFGGRKLPIHVKNVSFSGCSIIRLPPGIKFRIDNFEISTAFVGSSLDAFMPVLHESSFPLKQIKLNSLRPEDAYYPIVSEAEALKLSFHPTATVALLPNLANEKIIISANPTCENLRIILKHFRTRNLDTEYILFSANHSFSYLTSTIEDLFGEEALYDQTATIKVSDFVQVRLYYEKFPSFAPDQEWAIRILYEEVEPE